MSTGTTLSEAKRNLLQHYLNAQVARPRMMPSAIMARLSREPAPLTISQEQLILRESRRPDAPPLYNECIQLRMLGPLNVPALEKSFTDIIRRQDIWRTTYRIKNEQIQQIIHDDPEHVEMPLVDLQGSSTDDQEEQIGRVIGNLIQQPFNLTDGPLLRLRLIKLSNLEHRLYVVAHLSVVDGLSVYQIFPTELSALYRTRAFGESSHLDPLPIQFADYPQWQAAQTESFNEQLSYWSTQLAGEAPAFEWPNDRPRPPQESFHGEIAKFVLPVQLAQRLKALARAQGVSLFTVILSTLAALLHAYTSQDDFTIGTPSPSGRGRSDVEKLLGYFLTPVALRFRITSCMAFDELLKQAQRLTLEAISNDDLPVEVLAQKLGRRTDASRNPLFAIATSLQPAMPKLNLDWTVTSMDISSGGAPWDLYLAFIDGREEGMLGRVQYNPDLFEHETIDRFISHYLNLAQVLTESPNKQISDLP